MKSLPGSELAVAEFYRFHRNTDTISTWAWEARDSTLHSFLAGLKRQFMPEPVAVTGHGILERIYHAGVSFAGPLEKLLNDVIDPRAIHRLMARRLHYAAIFPVWREAVVFGALGVYSDSPLGQSQIGRLKSVASVMEQLVELSGNLGTGPALAAVTEERFRRAVAEELHGPIQTKLLLIISDLRATAGSSSAVASQLNAAIQRLEDLREHDIRQLSHRVHPGIIRVALRPALRQLEDEFASYVAVHLVISSEVAALDTPINSELSERTRLAIYRIVEEAMQNAVRHAQAKNVRVVLEMAEPHLLRARVWDDGVGFSQAKAGLGIYLMKSRARGVYGRVTIQSSPGLGTEVQALIPVRVRLKPNRILSRRDRHEWEQSYIGDHC